MLNCISSVGVRKKFSMPSRFVRAGISILSRLQTELDYVLVKARVAPMKGMKVPRLELYAALLAAPLKQDACRARTIKFNKVFSTTALLSCNG